MDRLLEWFDEELLNEEQMIKPHETAKFTVLRSMRGALVQFPLYIERLIEEGKKASHELETGEEPRRLKVVA